MEKQAGASIMKRAKISGAGSIRRDFIGVTLPRIAAPWLDRLVWRIPGHDGERVAYLTFDDGPTDEGTERLIDRLDDYEAQATFFLLGSQVDQHAHLRDTIEGAGHRVGVHGYAHLDAWTTRSAIVLSALGKPFGRSAQADDSGTARRTAISRRA